MYLIGATWNADPQDGFMRQLLDDPAKGQFSAFNGTCRIYSPFYREVHAGAVLRGSQVDVEGAIEVAYSDVERAFDYYLDYYNQGRPFFLVGHSQGSWHLEQLITDRIEGTALADSVVAAYIIGGLLRPDSFTEIPYCNDAQDTGCVVGWNTVAEGFTIGGFSVIDLFLDRWPGDPHCTNPLSWTVGGVGVPASQNPGSLGLGFFGSKGIEPGLVGASCRNDGLLGVSPLPPALRYIPIGQGDYHLVDYGLFYISIRENAQDRLDSYLQ
jgi:hypothetical protein